MTDRTTLRIVPDPHLSLWLEDALTAVSPIQDVCHPCPHCGVSVRYQVGVSEGDYKTMQKLIEIANRYLTEKGVTATMLTEIMARAHIEIARRKK